MLSSFQYHSQTPNHLLLIDFGYFKHLHVEAVASQPDLFLFAFKIQKKSKMNVVKQKRQKV